MPYDATGNYTRVHNWQDDRNNGIRILAQRMDEEDDSLAGALNQAFLRTGVVPMTGNLVMNGKAISQVKAGSVLQPGITFELDLDTGFFQPAAGQLGISVNGAQRSLWTDTGLAVTGAVAATGSLSGVDVAASGNLTVGGTTTHTGAVTFTGASTFTGLATFNGNLAIANGSTVSGNFAMSGNVTVGGTLGVTGGVTLTGAINAASMAISGNATVGGTLTSTGLATFNGNAVVNTALGVNVSPLKALHAKSTGEILRIDSTTARGAGQSYIGFADPSGNKGYVGYAGSSDTFYINNNIAAAGMSLATDGASRVFIAPTSGNVGINNTNPLTPLHVNGDTTVGYGGAANTYYMTMAGRSPAGGTVDWDFKTVDATNGSKTGMTLRSTGDLILNYNLNANTGNINAGTFTVQGGSLVAGAGIYGIPSVLGFFTSGAEGMRLQSGGLSIGTTVAPATNLFLVKGASVAAGLTMGNPANQWDIRTGTTGNELRFVDNQFSATYMMLGSGGVMIGGTTASGKLTLEDLSANTVSEGFRTAGGTGNNIRASIQAGYQAGGSNYGGYLSFFTNSAANVLTEAMRIDYQGALLLGTTATAPNARFVSSGGRSYFTSGGEQFAIGVQYNASGGAAYMGATNSASPDIVFSQTAGTEIARMLNAGGLLVSGAGGLGFQPGNGTGATVNQTVSRTNPITNNKMCGTLVLFNAASTSSWGTITVNNSLVTANDVVLISQKSGSCRYNMFVSQVGAGFFEIAYAGVINSATESPQINFAVIKSTIT